MRRRLSPILVVVLVPFSAALHAATWIWPGTACPTTLQACIDASAAGDEVRIATNDPIDEDLALGDHSLSLVPAVTLTAVYQPQLAPGRSINVLTPSASGSMAISLRGIRLTDAPVTLEYDGSGSISYDVRNLEITQTDGSAPVYLSIIARSGTATATVYGNRIEGDPPAYAGSIELDALGGTLNAYAAFNRVEHGDGSEKKDGILVQATGSAGSGTVRLYGNDLWLHDGSSAGIAFSLDPSSAATTLNARAYTNAVHCRAGSNARGLTAQSRDGTLDIQALNNTLDHCDIGVHIAEGAVPVSPVFSGLVWNNLIVADGIGLDFPGISGVANDYNLVNAPSNNATLGAHSITAPAGLGVATRPRLAAGSPAIDAADASTLANGIVDNGFPLLDVDGLRRSKGARADIGAYEFGDGGIEQIATADNTSGHITTLALDAGASAELFATRHASPYLAASYERFGVWFNVFANAWTIYHEDTALPILDGKAWHVFVPASGAGVFTHAATAANTGGWSTQIDNPTANGLADNILLVRHNFNLDSAYHDHPVAVTWTGSGSSGRWTIINADHVAMDVGAGFNVYAQPPSPNAFRLPLTTQGSFLQVIDHPLINGVACARPQVTLVRDSAAAAMSDDFAVEFETASSLAGYWLVRSPTPFTTGTSFNVLIDPAQVADCTDVIFADGFDG